jgi:hypothetical protein
MMKRRLLPLIMLAVLVSLMAGGGWVLYAALTLSRGFAAGPLTFVVQVLDESGNPIPGVRVSLISSRPEEVIAEGEFEQAVLQQATTDQFGVAALTAEIRFGYFGWGGVTDRTRRYLLDDYALQCVVQGYERREHDLATQGPVWFDRDDAQPHLLRICLTMRRVSLAPAGTRPDSSISADDAPQPSN